MPPVRHRLSQNRATLPSVKTASPCHPVPWGLSARNSFIAALIAFDAFFNLMAPQHFVFMACVAFLSFVAFVGFIFMPFMACTALVAFTAFAAFFIAFAAGTAFMRKKGAW